MHVSSWRQFKNSIMVQIKFLHSKPFMNSYFHFLTNVACSKMEQTLSLSMGIMLNNNDTSVE
jgi:hypothetical protein